jgi:glucosamine-6-phosphate deaminase
VAIDVDGPDPAAAAARHDREAAGLDLAILGLGINGHVGFNEPGSGPQDTTRVVEVATTTGEIASTRYGASVTPHAGITIGLARLLEAREAWLLVTGERKAEMLYRALHRPESRDCPASYLRRHARLTVFADEAAAEMLPDAGARRSPGTSIPTHPVI